MILDDQCQSVHHIANKMDNQAKSAGIWGNVLMGLAIVSIVMPHCVNSESDSQKYSNVGSILTPREQTSLERFKALVLPIIPSSSYVHKFSRHDAYLMHWLRAKLLDVRAAETMLLDHLKWREAQKIDAIDEEDWSEYQERYPVHLDNLDIQGKPTAEVWFTSWNVRERTKAGEQDRLVRWVTRILEMQTRQLYAYDFSFQKNVSQANVIIDLNEFSFPNQGCPLCVPFYTKCASVYESNYPGVWSGAYLLNMPESFYSVWNVVRPILRAETRKAFKLMPNRKEWEPFFDGRISKNQRSARLGGSIQYN